jgi:hypothetical protein
MKPVAYNAEICASEIPQRKKINKNSEAINKD